MDDAKIPAPFRIEPLCSLPCSLAKTELAVRPCVAFLHTTTTDNPDANAADTPTVDETLMPRLDAKEVAAVFSAPLGNFLRSTDEPLPAASDQHPPLAPLPPGHWYDGRWLHFHEAPWRVHNFHVPVNNQRVTRPKRLPPATNDIHDEGEEPLPQRFLVWGMTGRMLVDTARVAYAREPEFEHNTHYGDEALIEKLEAEGQLPEKTRARGDKPDAEVGLTATREDVSTLR